MADIDKLVKEEKISMEDMKSYIGKIEKEEKAKADKEAEALALKKQTPPPLRVTRGRAPHKAQKSIHPDEQCDDGHDKAQ